MSTAEPTRSARVSVTKLQRESLAAVELFAIVEALTMDGRLSPEEVEALRDWSTRHEQSPLPARDYLSAVIGRITADGVVTPEELDELYRAVEKVLPPDLRTPTVARRRAAETREQERDRVVGRWNFMVAGVHIGDREQMVARHASPDGDVFLQREPRNAHSRHAVLVQALNGAVLGYVPERMAREVAPLLDAGHPYLAWVTKILDGGRTLTPVVQAELFATTAEIADLRRPADAPPAAGQSSSVGCLPIALLTLGAATPFLWR